MFSSIRSFVNFLSSFEWTFRLSYDIWRHIWRHNHVSAFNKSKYQNSDTIIAFLGWKYVSIQIFSSIRSFVGILISFEWHFGLFYDTWRHIWRQNIVLPLQKVKMSKFWHHNRFSIPKNSPIHTLRPTQSFYWDIWRFRWFWDHFG